MGVLTTKARDNLPAKDFAGAPGHYPIENESHARNALARVSQYGTPALKAKVRAAVHRKYPNIGQEHEAAAKEISRRLDDKEKRRR